LARLKNDSAFYYFNKVVNESKDSLMIAMSYNRMALLQFNAGDYYSSQETLIQSFKYLEEENKRDHPCLSSNYNLLGRNSQNLENYDDALKYYDLAIRFNNVSQYEVTFLNNKALTFQAKQEYDKAIAIYQSILDTTKENQAEYPRVLSNLARTKWLADSNYNATNELLAALAIRKREKDDLGLNASYSHLSDYYSKSRPDSALLYAERMYEVALKNNSPNDQVEALDKLTRLSPRNQNSYFSAYQHLSDSIQDAKNAANNKFALIRYETEKSKADNLSLQRDNTRQRVLTVGIAVAAFALITTLLLWFRRRRQKIKQEAEKAIQESKLKTSQKIHDVVANGLYRIMNGLEHKDTIEKEPLINEIEVLYERSRNISYEDIIDEYADYNNQVHQLLTSFANEHTKVIVVGNQQTFWNHVGATQKHELQLVLNEIMVNMKKHSRAKNVVIHFKQEERMAYIHYKDDGTGFPAAMEFGNGLNNTVSRIKSLNGEVSFGKSGGEGVSIEISFPLESL
ncbi:MAG TPA: tetratricopeptide repeat protein, partial [Chitinophagaceae bacterium]